MMSQAAQMQVSSAGSAQEWSFPARLAFRFGFCYFVLYIYPTVLGARSSVQYDQGNPVRWLWDHIVPWVGSHVLHLPGPFTPGFNGSGDQMYDYILWLCLLVTAAFLAVLWSLLDRRRKQYDNLYEWLRVLVRLTVAIAMINYGMGKLFRFQFPRLSLAKLVDTYGQSSPQGLLWAVMDYSRAYSFIGGVGETVGGMLLLVPRFTTLGTLITLGMMSNVMMLNLFYDVPRKILCAHLLLMCVFLLWPDIRRLFGFFVLRKSEQLAAPRPLFRDRAFNKAALFFQLAIGIGVILYCAHHSYMTSERLAAQIDPSLRGIWNVDQFELDGALHPPLLTDTGRWKCVVFDHPDEFTVQLMDDTQQKFFLQWNGEKSYGSLWGVEDHAKKGSLTVHYLQADRMVLEAQVAGHRATAQLRRADLSDPTKFLLTNRGFHWVDPTMLLR